ncbi:MAG: Yip1 family protein [Candidatus Woesearchaeota archaeon]
MKKELIEYIQSVLSKGFKPEQVKQALRDAGYAEDDIKKAFEEIAIPPIEKRGYFWRAGKAILAPRQLFSAAKEETGMGEPVLFIAITGLILGAMLSSIWVIALQVLVQAYPILSILVRESVLLLTPVITFGFIIFLFAFTFIGAGIFHVSTIALGGTGRFYQTYRVLAYATALAIPGMLISLIPIAGQIVIGVWTLAVIITGISIMHGISKARALISILLPSIFILLFALLILLLLGIREPQAIAQAASTTITPQTTACTEKSPGQWCYAVMAHGITSEGCTNTLNTCLNNYNADLAAAQRDEKYCGKITDTYSKDMCYSTVAARKNDAGLCAIISDYKEKSNCIGTIAGQQANKEACETAPSKDDCYAAYGLVTGDKNICMLITDIATKQDCEFFTSPPPPPEL